jgi:glycosyltransferase involved in cell wall biosynthesis
MAPPRLTLVCPNLSENCLGRTLLLAELARPAYAVRVIGPQTTPEVWSPGESFDVPVVGRPLGGARDYPAVSRWLRQECEGSKILVCKPKPTSLGLALAARLPPKDVVLDVDDWDVGFSDAPRSKTDAVRGLPRRVRALLNPRKVNTYFGVQAMFQAVRLFPLRIVSNTWLDRRYGGVMIPHVRDTNVFDPARVDATALRAELDLSMRPWVGFLGTVRPHKGIATLVEALSGFRGAGAPGLLLAGIDLENPFAERLLRAANAALGAERVRAIPKFPFSELPRYLAAVDIVCIPSLPGTTSRGQIPAKLFDALAMGKPCIISDAHETSEMSDALERYPAGNAAELSAILTHLVESAERRAELSARARAIAVDRFSFDKARSRLHELLDRARVFKQTA